MLQASPKTPPKHKRRKVSAIRQFPRGCGPNAIKLRPAPVKNTPVLVGLENGKVTDTDNVLAAPNDSEKTLASSLLSLEKDTLDASGKTLASSLLALEKDTLDASESVKDLIPELAELPVSSAVLENSTEITKLDVQPLTENCDTLGDKVELKAVTKKVEMKQDMKSNNILEVDIECNPQKVILEVLQVSGESVEPPRLQNKHLYSKMYGHPRRRKVSAIREFPPKCGPNAVSIRKDNNPLVFAESYLDGKSLIEVKVDEAGKHLVGVDSIGVATFDSLGEKLKKNDGKGDQAKNDLHTYENLPQEKRSIGVGESLRVAAAENSLNHEKSIMKQTVAIDESEKASSCEKTGIADQKISKLTKGKERTIVKSDLSRSNSTKNFRIKSIGSHALIKSSLKSNSNEKSLLKIVSDETLVPSSSGRIIEDIKAGRTANSIHAKANASNPSHLVVKSHSGNKRLDEKDMPFMEKSIGIENEFNQKSSKKKMLPAEMHKGYTPGENDDSFGAIGERIIIQALMAAMNCPWRNTKRRSSVTSDSSVSKNKISKEKRILVNSLVSKDLVPYEPKCKGFTADDDVILDGDNELTIMMTPFVPPETSKKGGDDDVVAWHKVKRALRLFQLICRKLLQGEESRSKRLGKSNRIDLLAAGILKDNGEWVNTGESILGVVPGVEVGDEFHFRVELSVVGLHRPFQGGIDSVKKNGLLLATSIVASGGHQDDMDSSDVLIYSGAGGTTAVGGDKQQGDQKLERGNLALKNSIAAQTPVRVIHGFKEKGIDPHDARGKLISTFTYDGLYQVEAFWQEIGSNGFNVFKFQLRRRPGQPELALKELKRSAKLKNREGLCVKDISKGKEKILISVVNTIDTDQPMPFKYITKSIYPSWYTKTPPKGCDCTDGCSDSDKCACAVKNGGEIPYNYNGAIVQAKPLIYECGPSCKCSLSCHNRVGQRGIRIKLEIFKTRGRGWGVRSLKSIPSGYFICEYIGELLQDGEAEQRTNDEYLFDIGHNYDDHSLWEDLPNLIPGLQSKSEYDTLESVGFTIDAAEYGNVGRFINHSCSPNLYAQNVLYDHDDKRMPHIMFFAVDNIPPLQELTYHYNYTIDQVRDSEGNIKQKACHCGSPECCGRLY